MGRVICQVDTCHLFANCQAIAKCQGAKCHSRCSRGEMSGRKLKNSQGTKCHMVPKDVMGRVAQGTKCQGPVVKMSSLDRCK